MWFYGFKIELRIGSFEAQNALLVNVCYYVTNKSYFISLRNINQCVLCCSYWQYINFVDDKVNVDKSYFRAMYIFYCIQRAVHIYTTVFYLAAVSSRSFGMQIQ